MLGGNRATIAEDDVMHEIADLVPARQELFLVRANWLADIIMNIAVAKMPERHRPRSRHGFFDCRIGAAQEFSDTELQDPIMRRIDWSDPIARNPCLRRGPLSLDYWTRLPGDTWRSMRRMVGAD